MAKFEYIRTKYDGQSRLCEWYKECYPTDEFGYKEMNKVATFQDAFECLQVGFDFYAFLGVVDSTVRERVFDALATLMECSYEHVYYQWRDRMKKPLGDMLITDMSRLRFSYEQ